MSNHEDPGMEIETLSDDDLESVAGGYVGPTNTGTGTCESKPDCTNSGTGTCTGGDESF
jgi:hypothetical protein